MKTKQFSVFLLLFLGVGNNAYAQRYNGQYPLNDCRLKWTADSLFNEYKTDEAIAYYKQIPDEFMRTRDWYRMAICYCRINHPDSVAQYYERILQKGFYYRSDNELVNDSLLRCIQIYPKYEEYIQTTEQNRVRVLGSIDTILRNKFLELQYWDQYYRSLSNAHIDSLIETGKMKEFMMEALQKDSLNQVFLDSVITLYGRWPGYHIVGEEGDRAAWFIVQHADRNITFQEKCLPLLVQAFEQENTYPHNVAYLYDRIMINKGLQQRYATQLRIIDGQVIFINLEDEKNVDYYRHCFNLPPVLCYKREVEEQYIDK
jgi:hypothetical protein